MRAPVPVRFFPISLSLLPFASPPTEPTVRALWYVQWLLMTCLATSMSFSLLLLLRRSAVPCSAAASLLGRPKQVSCPPVECSFVMWSCWTPYCSPTAWLEIQFDLGVLVLGSGYLESRLHAVLDRL